MQIHIKDDYYIYTDSRQYICGRMSDKKQKDGTYKPELTGLSYHPSLKLAAQWFLDREIRASEAETLDQLSTDIREAIKTLSRALPELVVEIRT